MVQDPEEVRSKIDDNPENRAQCHCPLCPSYPHECDGEILYCGLEASKCDIKAYGCICDTCAVYYKYGLKGIYHCDKVEVGRSKTLIRKSSRSESTRSYQEMVDIKAKSAGMEMVSSMGSQKELPFKFDDLHLIPAQLSRIPLNQEEQVNTTVTIGPGAKKPFKVSSPLLVSGMSFGAVSKNVRLIIGKTAMELGSGFNSGEGGVLEEERQFSDHMIVQYSTGRFGLDEELIKNAAALEIRFGQGAYPGKGSYLPADKITSEVARIRGLERGEAAYSPAHHPDINNPQELEEKITWFKDLTGGSPVGAKVGCGNVEDDVRILAEAGVDFIALDGFGGGTGATTAYVRDNVGIPIIAALPRAFKALLKMGLKDKISLIAGGGLRSSADYTKCLALGADAVYLGTAALIAMNCEQYRICHSGLCPTGVTTQNPQLLKQLDLDEGIRKLKAFLSISNQELATLVRVVGKNNVSDLDHNDLVCNTLDLARLTGLKWLNGKHP
ncbi:MAG: FMN-binding glutamate synthase family protein [Methanobacteriaceae archaeon]